ncbi:MAG TPA: endo-1,4-beta-xylanase [Roseococcus sp.]|nr:endo-1,4-beta-xylanase [Roseococcus sp.]
MAAAGSAPLAAQPGPGPSLRSLSQARGLTFGTAVTHRQLREDPALAALLREEAALLVPEYEAKWSSLQPREGEFDFSLLNEVLAFAQRHGQRVRGHCLIWHEANPAWLAPALAEGPARAAAVLEAHLQAVLPATRTQIRDWDVVNEPIANPPGGDNPSPTPGDLRSTPWLAALGPAYVDRAFRTARQLDPTLRLTLNDYGMEADTPWAAEKRARLLRLVRGMLERRVPLDAVGLQGHLQMREAFRPEPLILFLHELRALGLATLVTELDIREPDVLAPGIAARDAAVAERAGAFLGAAIEGGARTILTWGLSDRDSWLGREPAVARPDGVVTRGLPYDAALRPKPFRAALGRAFGG